MGGELPGPVNILAVCTGNICRSPMAEGILGSILQHDKRFRAFSAGTHAMDGNPATNFAIAAAMEEGVDLRMHRARMLGRELIRNSHFVLCMERTHAEEALSLVPLARDRVFMLGEFAFPGGRTEDIPDPYGCSLREYRECFRLILAGLNSFIEVRLQQYMSAG